MGASVSKVWKSVTFHESVRNARQSRNAARKCGWSTLGWPEASCWTTGLYSVIFKAFRAGCPLRSAAAQYIQNYHSRSSRVASSLFLLLIPSHVASSAVIQTFFALIITQMRYIGNPFIIIWKQYASMYIVLGSAAPPLPVQYIPRR